MPLQKSHFCRGARIQKGRLSPFCGVKGQRPCKRAFRRALRTARLRACSRSSQRICNLATRNTPTPTGHKSVGNFSETSRPKTLKFASFVVWLCPLCWWCVRGGHNTIFSFPPWPYLHHGHIVLGKEKTGVFGLRIARIFRSHRLDDWGSDHCGFFALCLIDS